jgi:hypothetical protein
VEGDREGIPTQENGLFANSILYQIKGSISVRNIVWSSATYPTILNMISEGSVIAVMLTSRY